jgi:PAS domain S-box-containing protein
MHDPATLRTAAQYAVARILADAATVEEATVPVLRALGEALGWEIGALWTIDASANRLRCVGVWHTASSSAADFIAVTREASFESGVGLPGRVWATGAAAWIADVAHDPNFPRAASAARGGLHAAFGFPITVHGQCLGVIEFLTGTVRTPDADLLGMMGSIGNQLGQFIARNRLEASARKSQATNAAIVAAALDCIVTMNHEGRIVEFNPAAERTFGYKRSEVVGRFMADVIIPPSLRDRHRAGLAHYLATGEGPVLGRRLEMTALHADGHEFPVELAITPLPSENPPVFTGFIRDITDRRLVESERSESAAREQNARRAAEEAERRASFLADAGVLLSSSRLDYEATFANMVRLAVPDIADWCAAHVVEDDGTIRCVALAHRDPGITAAAWRYVKDYRFDPDAPDGGPRVIRSGQPVLQQEVPDDLIVKLARDPEDLRIRQLLGLKSVVAVPLTSGGRVLGALAFVMSQSGRRYEPKDLAFAEDLARRAGLAIDNALLYREAQAANRIKDEFLATLSHELRTPLNAIVGWCRMLLSGRVAETEREHALRVIERNAVSQNAIINDLLDMSRIISGRLPLNRRPVKVQATIEAAMDSIRPSAQAKGIDVETSIDPTARAASLLADPERLQQILWNLLSNAVKFTARAGRIRIAATATAADMLITVSDTGEGIDPAMLPHVFERFRQADSSSRRPYGGLGLGLAIVRQLTELHGGTVEAQSGGPGQGATFSLRLPLSPRSRGQVTGTAPRQEVLEGRLSGLTIVVVEDDPDARDLFRLILTDAGSNVSTASSTAEALAVITTARPDVLVADIGLPGEDGNDLVRKVRGLPDPETARLPAVAVSAYASEHHRQTAQAAGFQAYLAKPVDPSELVRVIARLLGREPAGNAT